MSGALDVRVVELLVARLCHDLAGPVGAIANGSELLTEEAPDLAGETLRVLAESAREAAGRLQFYRFAYGGAGNLTALATAPAELAARFFRSTPIICEFAPPARLLTSVWQKLAFNLLLVGAAGLPRGGRLTVNAGTAGPVLDGEGEAVSLGPELLAALTLQLPSSALTPRTVQAYFAALLARELGRRLVAGNPHGPHFRIGTAPGSEQSTEDVRAPSAA
jgi:histidine phosphotransferase ChpT